MNNLTTQNKYMAAFKNARPAQALQTLNSDAGSLADGIGSSYGIIHFKPSGGSFTLKYRGEVHVFTRADDGTPASHIDLVFLRDPGHKCKVYYPIGKVAGEGERPECSSLDYVRPDADVKNKQADVCALCKRNERKMMPNGKMGRECKDYKQLAVFPMPEQTARMLGSPHIEPVLLRIPPDSLIELAKFGEDMERQGWHYSQFVTRVKFDPTTTYARLIFEPLFPLGDEEGKLIAQLREEPLAKRITGEEVVAAPVTVEREVPRSIGLVEALGQKTVVVEDRIVPPYDPSIEDDIVVKNDHDQKMKDLDDQIANLMKV